MDWQALDDPSIPIDLDLLDAVAIHGMSNGDQEALDLARRVHGRPDAFSIVEPALKGDTYSSYTKMLALLVFQRFVRERWRTLSPDEQNAYRSFVVSACSEPNPSHTSLLPYFNTVFLEILKFEWPQTSPTLLHDFIQAASTTELTACNVFSVLADLAVIISDFADDQLTSSQTAEMRQALLETATELVPFFESALTSDTSSLVIGALQTLQKFVTTLDHHIVVDTPLFEIIGTRLLIQES
jgi:hypothetical protein